jgi:endonuclease YncB( thermonuclease family)
MKRLAVAAVTALMMIPTPAAATVDYVVDGDTFRLQSGVYVRLIGVDTPEVGECGYRAAKRKLDQWVGGNVRPVNPAGVDDRDSYGRLLRYVHDSGRDTAPVAVRTPHIKR